eukprot:6201009-Pleurochrysis_carterae.AAC.1
MVQPGGGTGPAIPALQLSKALVQALLLNAPFLTWQRRAVAASQNPLSPGKCAQRFCGQANLSLQVSQCTSATFLHQESTVSTNTTGVAHKNQPHHKINDSQYAMLMRQLTPRPCVVEYTAHVLTNCPVCIVLRLLDMGQPRPHTTHMQGDVTNPLHMQIRHSEIRRASWHHDVPCSCHVFCSAWMTVCHPVSQI